jgi:coenzyme F420-0:L-glutamate ligase/coenzyme F420-1:gamma-L-glutamate ligase
LTPVTTLTLTALTGIPVIRPGDNLARILYEALQANQLELQDGDILVLAQKIVSKAEGRFTHLSDVEPSAAARELARMTEKDPRFIELVLRESKEVLRTRVGTIIVEHRLGFVCANAGIDHSNVSGPDGRNPEEWFLLLPTDPDQSARQLQRQLEQDSSRRVGIAIIDSHGRAWRNGTVGVAIGVAGLPGLVDLRGTPDMNGYQLRITQVGAADELAAAASLVMGQAAEGTPAVHVRGFPYPLRASSLQELIRPKDLDLFR